MSSERKLAMDIHGEAGKVAKYLSAKFMQLRERKNELLRIEAHWDVNYLAEIDLAASILHQAIDNQSKRSRRIIPTRSHADRFAYSSQDRLEYCTLRGQHHRPGRNFG